MPPTSTSEINSTIPLTYQQVDELAAASRKHGQMPADEVPILPVIVPLPALSTRRSKRQREEVLPGASADLPVSRSGKRRRGVSPVASTSMDSIDYNSGQDLFLS